jgi:D-alanine transaminase
MHATLRAAGSREATIYIHITRGAAPRRHAYPDGLTPLELLWVQEYRGNYDILHAQGGKVTLHPDLRWGRCDIKSTNLLANVLVNRAAHDAGAVEALLYLPDGRLTEASHSTFFAVREGELITTPRLANILPGITREFVVDLVRAQGLVAKEHFLHRSDLPKLDELFLTGTTFEVVPILAVDDVRIGNGTPGPMTRRVQQLYADAVAASKN